jgi:hypothetical protein
MIWGTDSNITSTDVDNFFSNPISLTGLDNGNSEKIEEINTKLDSLATFTDTDGNESNGYEIVKLTDNVVAGDNNVSVNNISNFVSHVAVNNSVDGNGELNASYVKGDLNVSSITAVTANIGTLTAKDANISGYDINDTFANIDSRLDTVEGNITNLEGNLTAEIDRAKAAEGNLSADITDVNTTLTKRIAADESNFESNVTAINSRINEVNSSLAAEVTRAKNAEGNLSDDITDLNTTLTKRIAADESNFENNVTAINNRIDDVNESLNNEITRATNAEEELSTEIANETQRAQTAEDALAQQITDVNTTLTNRVASDEENFADTKAEFEAVTNELNTTLQYNVARLDALADYKVDGTPVTLTDYKADTSVFSNPDLVIELKEAVDATNAKANDEALGSVQEDTDTLEEEQQTGSLFVEFFKRLFK